MPHNLKFWTSNITDFTAFQIIQCDFIAAPAIHYIRLKLYMNVLCCSHLQVADPSKNAHDNIKHIDCFVLFCFVDPDLCYLRRRETTNNEQYYTYQEIQRRNPGVLRSCSLTSMLEPHPVNCVLHYAVAVRYYQHFFTI